MRLVRLLTIPPLKFNTRLFILADKYALTYEVKNGNSFVYGQSDLYFRTTKRRLYSTLMMIVRVVDGFTLSPSFKLSSSYEKLRKLHIDTWTAKERLELFNKDKIKMERVLSETKIN